MNETLKGASHNAPRNESHSGARGRFSRAPLERNLIFKIEHFGVGLLYIFERRRAPKRREARVNLLPYPPPFSTGLALRSQNQKNKCLQQSF